MNDRVARGALFGQALAATCAPEELICGTAVAFPEERSGDLAPGIVLPPGRTIHCLALAGRVTPRVRGVSVEDMAAAVQEGATARLRRGKQSRGR